MQFRFVLDSVDDVFAPPMQMHAVEDIRASKGAAGDSGLSSVGIIESDRCPMSVVFISD